MNSKIKTNWVNSLRNEQYPQARKGVFLREVIDGKESFGVIGVLVEQFRQENEIESTPEFWANCWTGETLKQIERWAGFKFEQKKYMGVFASIMQANTHLHQIQAVWVRKYMPVTKFSSTLKLSI